MNLYGFSSLDEDLRQYWTAEGGCLATPGSAFMKAQPWLDCVRASGLLGGDEERLDEEEMLAREESQAEDEESEELVDEAERLRWQL